MKRVRAVGRRALLTVAILVLASTAFAQDLNPQEKTFLTFSDAIELPDMMLEAGTYTFRLANTPARNVVQVLSQDEQKVFGQFLFVQANRTNVTDETVITFKETNEGATPAVQYWYYPGEAIGKELIYPKDQAMKIAERTGQKVRTEEGFVDAHGEVSEPEDH